MLGRDLVSCLEQRHCVLPLTRKEADITDSTAVDRAFDKAEPDIVIHCAAFTAVDDCEIEPQLASNVNAEGTHNVARACRRRGTPLLYLSTDYVFDGLKIGAYVEDDPISPLSVYGASKAAGEQLVRARVAEHYVVRTSGLFGAAGSSGKGGNFVERMLQLAAEGRDLRVVDEQRLSPTSTADLAAALLALVQAGRYGT